MTKKGFASWLTKLAKAIETDKASIAFVSVSDGEMSVGAAGPDAEEAMANLAFLSAQEELRQEVTVN